MLATKNQRLKLDFLKVAYCEDITLQEARELLRSFIENEGTSGKEYTVKATAFNNSILLENSMLQNSDWND